MTQLLKKLSGGKRTSLGRTNEIVTEVLRKPEKFAELFSGLLHPDRIVRMRVADAVEKISRQRPDLIENHKRDILRLAAATEEIEVRWHMAQLLPRLPLSNRERAVSLDILFDYLSDRSSIVKTHAMQALADFATQDAALTPQIVPVISEMTQVGTPAMRARGRKLLRALNQPIAPA